MPYSFNNKKVLITGATRGIGRACAIALASKGADVCLVGRDKKDLENVANAVKSYGNRFLAINADITIYAKVVEVVEQTKDKFGRIDLLINNAGVALNGPVDGIEPSDIEYTFKLNFFAATWFIQQVLPIMKSQNDGRIINISSIAGKRGFPFLGGYCASKFALNGLTESLRVELHSSGIKVLLVCPGGVDTAFYRDGIGDTSNKGVDTSKYMTPEYVSNQILDAICNDRREITLGLKGKIILFLNWFSKNLVDKLLSRMFST